jgi:hypothetical protein
MLIGNQNQGLEIMAPQHPADEYADILAELARLRAREAFLVGILDTDAVVVKGSPTRPGWPIQRTDLVERIH